MADEKLIRLEEFERRICGREDAQEGDGDQLFPGGPRQVSHRGPAGAVKSAAPDMSVLREGRRPAPALPLETFGPWHVWIEDVAQGAGCPVDYVAAPFLAALSALV